MGTEIATPELPAEDTPQEDANVSEDDEQSSSSEEEPTMVVTRERRANAGSRMSKLLELAEAEDAAVEEEGYAELFRETADDRDFAGDAEEDGDVSMSSSSEDEDGGHDDEEAGEQELKKQEHAAKGKKRKRETLLQQTMRLKKLKYAPTTKSALQTQHPSRPKKKSERVSWLPAEEDAPVRSSTRKLAVANKQATHSRLKESERRRLRTVAMMQAAEERKKASQPKIMTQAERLARAAQIERQNSKSLNKWEEDERRRQEEQQARMDALKNRKLDGPVITYWSGPSLWLGDRLRQVGKTALIEEVATEQDKSEKQPAAHNEALLEEIKPSIDLDAGGQEKSTPTGPSTESVPGDLELVMADATPNDTTGPDVLEDSENGSKANPDDAPKSASFLHGIEYWASLPQHITHPEDSGQASLPLEIPHSSLPPVSTSQSPTKAADLTSHDTGTLPQTTVTSNDQPQIRSIAARTLLTLTSFPRLSSHAYSHRVVQDSEASANSIGRGSTRTYDRDALLRALFSVPPIQPLSELSPSDANATRQQMTYDPLPTASSAPRHSTRYLSKRAIHCAVTGHVARYRDPFSGLPYATSAAFRSLRRLVAGGHEAGEEKKAVWSGLLGAWIGDARPASVVPKDVWDGTYSQAKTASTPMLPVKNEDLAPPPGKLDSGGIVDTK